MIREIVEKGDAVLTKRCHPVTRFDRKLALLLDDMRETLVESGGVGLAAPQVGIQPRDHRNLRGTDGLGRLSIPARHVRQGHPAYEGEGPCPGSERQLV